MAAAARVPAAGRGWRHFGSGAQSLLESWIAPQHLGVAGREEARQTLAQGLPFVLDDFLLPNRLADLREIYAEPGWLDVYGTHGAEHEVDVETWRNTPDRRRLFHYEELGRPSPGHEFATGMLASVRLRMLFGAAAFIDWLSELTGVTVGAPQRGRPRRMRAEHYLRIHNDSTHDRNLCLVLYLHERWTEDFGARFRLTRLGQPGAGAEPLPGRMLLFRPLPGVAHYVAGFGPGAAGWERRSLSNWYAVPD